MRIFGISDLHGNLDGIDPAGYDVVCIAGDFAKLSSIGKWQWYDQKKWVQKKFINWINKYPDIKFVIVAGNHDFCMDATKTRLHTDLDWNINWPSNVFILNNSSVVIDGVKFYGSPNVPIISYRWAFESEHDQLVECFSKIPSDVDVLITHTPPRIPDALVDVSTQWGNDSEAFGSSELANAIFEKNPKHVLCGHIHTGDHKPIRFGNSIIHNVSRLNEDYCIAYEPLMIEI